MGMTEHEKQEKRAKVINGLEWCMCEKHDCYIEEGCPYENDGDDVGCKYALHRDALALLNAQENEIEELKQEIEGHKDNLRETLDEMMRYADELKAKEPRLVEPNDFENADDFNWLPAWCEERTGACYWEMILPDALDEKDVRYWTGRPTDEQQEAIPWER